MFDFQRMRWLIRNVPKMAFEVEQSQARAELSGIQYSDMPGSKSKGDKVQRDVIHIIEVSNAYSEVLEQLKDMQDQLSVLIDKLQNPDQKAVMRLRYLYGHSPQTIALCNLVPMARMTVYRQLRKAEYAIQKMVLNDT